jgi:hypothetical protein
MTIALSQHYGLAEGPLGFPQTDRQARALEAILKAVPKGDEFRYRKALVSKAPTEVLPGERSDVSWISTEDPDRTDEVVLAKGMNDSQFALNPIVTLNHCYGVPPVGKSLWRKRVKDGPRAGIKAKTLYPALPASWPAGKDWLPDVAFTLVQADLLRGKSIGFLPVKVHTPSEQERSQLGWNDVALVIDEWILLEYACVFLPAQQNAVVEQVSKSLGSTQVLAALGLARSAGIVPHCRLETIEAALERAIARLDLAPLVERAIAGGLSRWQGRI